MKKNVKKKMVEHNVCGEDMDVLFNGKEDVLNVELVHVGGDVGDGDGFFALDFENQKGRLFRLHITEAIALKAVIDRAVYEANVELSIISKRGC